MQQRQLRVLIAEDSSVTQKIMLRMLQQLGCFADVVSNGVQAFEAVNTIRYDIVFMDMHMPEMGGIEATQKIVNYILPADRPRIVALTAESGSDDKELCIEAGMDDYITKPVRLEDVISTIRCWAPLHMRKDIMSLLTTIPQIKPTYVQCSPQAA